MPTKRQQKRAKDLERNQEKLDQKDSEVYHTHSQSGNASDSDLDPFSDSALSCNQQTPKVDDDLTSVASSSTSKRGRPPKRKNRGRLQLATPKNDSASQLSSATPRTSRIVSTNSDAPISKKGKNMNDTESISSRSSVKKGRPSKTGWGGARVSTGSDQREKSVDSIDALTGKMEAADMVLQVDKNASDAEESSDVIQLESDSEPETNDMVGWRKGFLLGNPNEKVTVQSDPSEPIDFANVDITFATERNFNCLIWRRAGMSLYARDADFSRGGFIPPSGPRRIEFLWNNPGEWLDDKFLYGYLCYLATLSSKQVIVVDSLITEQETISRSVQHSVTGSCFNYDANKPTDVVVLPLFHGAHWSLMLYDHEIGVLHHADPIPGYARLLQNPTRIQQLKQVINQIIAGPLPDVIDDPSVLTPQSDGCSCGYFVCLYAESWLMNERTFILPNLDVNFEKKRILWHLNSLYGRDDVPYHPRIGVSPPTAPTPVPSMSTSEPSRSSKFNDTLLFVQSTRSKPSGLGQADVSGDNAEDEHGTVISTIPQQTPMTNPNNDDDIFVKPKLPVRRSARIRAFRSVSPASVSSVASSPRKRAQTRSPSPAQIRSPSPAQKVKSKKNTDGSAIKMTKRCYMVHKGWYCAASSAKHFPIYFHSGNLGDKVCPYPRCKALLFPHETSAMCCRNGRVELPPLTTHPTELRKLIIGGPNQAKEGKEFVRNMRKYNNLFQFASVKAGSEPSPPGGPMAVILNGDFHRRISSMRAGSLQTPSFSQLYIVDPETAMDFRIKNPIFTGTKSDGLKGFIQGHKLNENIMMRLEKMLNRVHPAAHAFKYAKQQLDQLLSANPKEELKFFRLTLLDEREAPAMLQDPNLHPHQIIKPSTAGGFFSVHADPGGVPEVRGIWVENKEGQLHELFPYNSWTDCLCYPLIKPNGDAGYHLKIPYAKPPKKPKRNRSKMEDDDDKFSISLIDDDVSVGTSDTESVVESDDEPAKCGKGREFVSLRDHVRFYLAIRAENAEYHPILSCGGGLGQQWNLDQSAKAARQKADFIRRPEMDRRVSTPQKLLEYFANIHNKQQRKNNPNAKPITAHDIGSVVRFTSHDKNTAPYMQKMYSDLTVIFSHFYEPKKARLFITFTNNTEWPENKEHFYNNGQVLTDRFDIWMRVWAAKAAHFKHQLLQKNIFGKISAWGGSMEFQGRGGPHLHIMAQTDLAACPEVIQDYIWAHIPPEPDADDDTEIAEMHKLIRQLIPLQLHRCDTWCDPKDPATGECDKGFPAPFSKITILHPDRPAQYYRPSPEEGGAKIIIGNREYDNSHVVPYNPFVLCQYQVHHNILFGYGDQANQKYCMKYSFKEGSKANLVITKEDGTVSVDEPHQFAQVKFQCATEAWADIMSLPRAELSHKVVELDIHLENQQRVVFRAFQAEEMAEKIKAGDLPDTKLSAYWKQWRKSWRHDPNYDEKDYLFERIPENFRWDQTNKLWVRYKRERKTLGRIRMVYPKEQERFALYILMKHFAGDPAHLKLVNGQACATFVEAATKRGLLHDDKVWHQTLEESASKDKPHQIRQLFVSILVWCKPQNVSELWEKFKQYMRPRSFNPAQIDAYDKETIKQIDRQLFNYGLTCSQFNLPEPENPLSRDIDQAVKDFFLGDDPATQQPIQPQKTSPSLNIEQQEVFDAVLKALYTDPGDQTVPRRFFVTGDGGTGKTFMYKDMIKRLRGKPYKRMVLATASTGCAAILLPHGCTTHSAFRLGYIVDLDNLASVPLESFFAQRIRKAELVIVDEISMLTNTVIEAVDRMCKHVSLSHLQHYQFAGKVIIFSGDFKQSLPVLPQQGILSQVAACFKKSKYYHEFTRKKLTINQRMGPGEQEYLAMIRPIGTGETGPDFWVPPEFLVNSLEELIDFIYPDLPTLIANPRELLQRLILAPHNVTVDEINQVMLDRMPGKANEYLSFDQSLIERPLDIDACELEVSRLNQRNSDSGMPHHCLKLKVGCPVVLLKNYCDRDHMVNGIRMVIKQLREDSIVADIIDHDLAGITVILPRIWNTFEDKKAQIAYERLQFPIKLAYAMTINKAQGQSVAWLGICLALQCFSPGQLYTAWSRARVGKQVRVYAPNSEKNDKGAAKVRNVTARGLIDLDD